MMMLQPIKLAARLAAEGTVADHFSQNAPAPATTAVQSGSSIASIFEVIIVLAILVFCIVFVVRFLKNRVTSRGEGVLETLAVHSITQNRSVAVVKIADYVYVLGVGDNVQLLDIIRDPDVIEKLGQSSQQFDTGFDLVLRKKLEQIASQRKKLESWDSEQ